MVEDNTISIVPQDQEMVCKKGHSWVGTPITVSLYSGKERLMSKPICIFCALELLNQIAVEVK